MASTKSTEKPLEKGISLSTVRGWLPSQWGDTHIWKPAEVALNEELDKLRKDMRQQSPDMDLFTKAIAEATTRHYYSGVQECNEENVTVQTITPSPKYGTTVDPALSQEGQAGRVRAKIPVNYYIGNYSYDDDDDEDYNHDDNEDDDGDDGENIVVARSNETINEKFSQQSSDKLRGHDVNAGQFSARKRARDDHVDDPMQSHKKQQRQEKDLVSDLRARLSDNNTLLTQGLAPKGLVRRAAGWPMTGSQSDHIRALCRAITDHQAQCYDSMTSSAQSKDALLIFFNDQEKMKPSGKRYWMKDWSDSYMEALGRRVKEILPSSSTAPSTAPAPSNNQATMTSAYPTRILPSLSTVPSTVPSTAPTSSSNQATTPPEHSARVAGDLIPSSSGNTVTDSRRGPGLAGDNRRSQVAWACFYPQR